MRQPLLEVDDLRVAVYSERRGLEAAKRGEVGSGLWLSGDLELPAGWVQAIHGVSFAVHPGETLALVGESASGKSLIVMGALGLLPAGAVTIGGTTRIEGYEADIPDLREQQKTGSMKERIVRRLLPMRPEAVDDPESSPEPTDRNAASSWGCESVSCSRIRSGPGRPTSSLVSKRPRYSRSTLTSPERRFALGSSMRSETSSSRKSGSSSRTGSS